MSAPAAVTLAGVPITPMPTEQLAELLARWALEGGRPPRVAFDVYADCVNHAQRDPEYRRVLAEADLNYIDGMGVLLALRVLGVAPEELQKSTTTDLVHPVCRRLAGAGGSVFLLGARPGVAEAAGRRLAALHPGLEIAGTHHGYLRPGDDADAIAAVNASGAQLLIVCMGVPREQRWVAEHRESLDVGLVMTGGGLFDFLSGRVRRGPRWMTDHGLEWLFRLSVEPRRLGRRYLAGNPRFALLVAREAWRQRRR